MRLQDRTSNSANGVFFVSLPSMVGERSSMNPGARWTNKKSKRNEDRGGGEEKERILVNDLDDRGLN